MSSGCACKEEDEEEVGANEDVRVQEYELLLGTKGGEEVFLFRTNAIGWKLSATCIVIMKLSKAMEMTVSSMQPFIEGTELAI